MTIVTCQHEESGGYIVNGSITVPYDPDNKDYQTVQDWIADGNTPDPVSP